MMRNATQLGGLPPWARRVDWAEVSCQNRSMYVALLSIDSSLAAEMLQLDENFRASDARRVRKYAEVMEDGGWEVNGETLKAMRDGTIVDGRHRLLGCIEGRGAFTSLVVLGVPGVQEADRGKARSLSESLRHAGHVNTISLAAAINFAWKYEVCGNTFRHTRYDTYPTVTQALEFLSSNPGIKYCTVLGNRAHRLMPASRLAAILFCGGREAGVEGVAVAEEFIDGILNGVEGNFHDPRHLLHIRLTANATSKQKLPHHDMMAMTIKAWNLYMRGVTATPASIRWRGGGDNPEDFPKLIKQSEL
jgi:hypothetical protein